MWKCCVRKCLMIEPLCRVKISVNSVSISSLLHMVHHCVMCRQFTVNVTSPKCECARTKVPWCEHACRKNQSKQKTEKYFHQKIHCYFFSPTFGWKFKQKAFIPIRKYHTDIFIFLLPPLPPVVPSPRKQQIIHQKRTEKKIITQKLLVQGLELHFSAQSLSSRWMR